MKKITSFLLLFSSLYSNAQTFGRYGDCTGRGLCSINEDAINRTTPNQKLVLLTSTDSTVILKIFIKNLTPSDEIKILGKVFSKINIKETLVFIMEKEFLFQEIQKKLLQIPMEKTKIVSGLYPIQLTSDEIIVHLKIK